MEKYVLAKCLKTYPDEDDMIKYCDGEVSDVKIYHKGRRYFVVDYYFNENYYEVIEPKVYKV